MKVCLSSRQGPTLLNKADEIKISYRDINSFPTVRAHYPDKNYILVYPFQMTETDIAQLSEYAKLSDNITVCLNNWQDHNTIPSNVKWYPYAPVNTFFSAKELKSMGVSQMIAGSGLFFHYPQLIEFGMPFRLIPNAIGTIPEFAVYGTYIRPEDIDLYDCPFATVEFEDVSLSGEEALYRIYFEQKEFPGPIDMIIPEIGLSTPNRMIPPIFGERRLNCGHICMEDMGAHCKFCSRIFKTADTVIEAKAFLKTQINPLVTEEAKL